MATDKENRSNVREFLDAAAKEMGFAVDSIRNEVIEKGWFGRELTPDAQGEWLRDPLDPETSMQGPQDFSKEREAVYGRDSDRAYEHEVDREQDLER